MQVAICPLLPPLMPALTPVRTSFVIGLDLYLSDPHVPQARVCECSAQTQGAGELLKEEAEPLP